MTERATRSIKASPGGISQANIAVLTFATKIDLATELKISRATVQKFFAGKPVGRENFHKICQKLKLPWQEVAELPKDAETQPQVENHNSFNIDALVQEVRQKGRASIEQRCGRMRVLDMSQPIELNDIYTNVKIIEKISGRRRLEVADLLEGCAADEFIHRALNRTAQDRVLGLEAVKNYSKLMVLGKPGAGKTTFLRYIAIQCSLGKLKANLVPIFITLKNFAETEQRPSLLEYVTEEFATYGITDTAAEQVLSHGKALILLDGLDEVSETDENWVLQEIRHFTVNFHANHFVTSCRIAAQQYIFEQFTEVEITDFDNEQIASFATNWFAAKDPIKSNRFIHKLKENRRIQELATCPLLLTLLCLVFEESAEFPLNRSALYKEGLNVLLKKWDDKRNIKREQVYKKLSVQHKEDLLSQIALMTFERGDYFFRQKEIEQYIAKYILNLPDVSTDIDALQLDSEAVLKSIEAQHGLLVERAHLIYSFSHLTFQEYFTAREIVAIYAPQALEKALKNLVSHVTEKRWREVFLLTVGMLRNASYMLQLMKRHIDNLVAQDEQLQVFLTWLSKKVSTVTAPHKSVAVRAFYITLERILTLVGDSQLTLDNALVLTDGTLEIAFTLDHTLTLNRTLELNLALDHALDLALDRALTLALARALALNRLLGLDLTPALEIDSALALELDLTRALDLAMHPSLNPELEQSLKQLEVQLPDPDVSRKKFKQWWKEQGGAWIEQLRSMMISHRKIGRRWQFSEQQRRELSQYYDANELLVDCLNTYCYVTRGVRQEIEETLFLPIIEIQQRKGSALKEG